MTKTFIYNVNDTLFEDTKAFGQAWKNAKAFATKEHTTITRTVVTNNETRYEFFAKGGCFLSERFYTEEKIKIF